MRCGLYTVSLWGRKRNSSYSDPHEHLIMQWGGIHVSSLLIIGEKHEREQVCLNAQPVRKWLHSCKETKLTSFV